MNRKLQLSLTLATVATLLGAYKNEVQEAPHPARAVSTVIVEAQPFILSSDLPGRIEAVRVAEVRARVAGIVLSKRFEEGAEITAGQVLFEIDPAPFKAAHSRAMGELARAEAVVFEAQTSFKRYEWLIKTEAVSQQDYDTAHAALKGAQAAALSAQADVETAQLNLDYASVKAPISGRIGRAFVTEGALVGQGEGTLLATIQQLDPIYVDFMQPAADVVRMRSSLSAGKLTATSDSDAMISVLIDGSDQRHTGRLLFTDVTVDRGTGQVALRGELPNPHGLLLPGMYARVKAGQVTLPAAILVPQRAVQRSTDGKPQVLVVNKDNVVEARPVETGAMSGSQWHIVSGLSAGEQIVVGGTSGLWPGETVKPQPEASSPSLSEKN